MKRILKLIIILVSVLNLSYLFSQTKLETENWIKNKINSNDKNIYSDPNLIAEEFVFFKDGFLYNKSTIGVEDYVNILWEKVEIKNIKKIRFRKNSSKIDNNTWVTLTIITEKGTIYEKADENNIDHKSDNEFSLNPELNGIEIRLNSNFISSGLSTRMEKAFKHLVKIYGGNLIIDKEPF